MDRAEHLRWAKDRALEYVKIGDLDQAMASMISDLRKHPETENHLGSQLMLMGANGWHDRHARTDAQIHRGIQLTIVVPRPGGIRPGSKTMIYGTEWTAPNTGATVEDLCHALRIAGRSETKRLKAMCAVRGPDARTNLRLTGDRLVDYDEERIAACYVTLRDTEAQP